MTGPNPNRELAWLPRLQADALMWERIVETVNQNHPPSTGGFPVKLIPAGRVLGAVAEAAEEGSIPGFSGIEDFFGRVAVYNDEGVQIFDGDEPRSEPDFIHLNYYGKYIIASVHAAVLSGRTPEGYTFDVYTIHGTNYWDTPNWWGYSQSRPDAESIQAFQQIIADQLNELYDPE